jgi:hypothetical protein
MQQQDLIAASGIALASAAFLFLASFAFSAWLQKRALIWVGHRFLDIRVEGRVFLACFIGGLLGWGAAAFFSDFGADFLAYTAFLLAVWPFLHLWVKEQATNEQLSTKAGALLSATSAIVSAAIISLVWLVLKLIVISGWMSFLGVLIYNQ